MVLLRSRQRHRYRPRISGPNLYPLSAAPRQGGIPRHGNRLGDLPKNCRAARRNHLGRINTGARGKLLLHLGKERRERKMSSSTLGRPVEILLVEDSPGDIRLTQEALKEGKVLNNLSVVGDGAAAIDFLRRRGIHREA